MGGGMRVTFRYASLTICLWERLLVLLQKRRRSREVSSTPTFDLGNSWSAITAPPPQAFSVGSLVTTPPELSHRLTPELR